MGSQEILELVLFQNGFLTQEQYIDIYDNSPTLECVFINENSEYEYELIFSDKYEPILCNVVLE
jgi:hypothetical protein